MSEYMFRSPHDKPNIDDTLFDDAMIEAMAVGRDRESVMQSLGVEASPESYLSPEVVTPVEPARGAALDLGMRATALQTIMDYYNYDSQVAAVKRTRGVGGNRFDEGYRLKNKSGADVYARMLENDALLKDHADEAFDVLNATNALRDAGFDEEAVRQSRNLLVRQASDYAPGVSDAKKREALMRQPRQAAGMPPSRRRKKAAA
jgi:hypothetical protein